MLDESLTEGDFPTCSVCRTDQDARERWGCDAPVSRPYLEMSCVVCHGRSDACTHCQGRGKVPLFRCPWKLISRYDMYAVSCAILFLENGALPNNGCLGDQPGTFHDVLGIVAGVRGEVQSRKMKGS